MQCNARTVSAGHSASASAASSQASSSQRSAVRALGCCCGGGGGCFFLVDDHRACVDCRQNGCLSSRGGCPSRWHSLVSCDHGD
eukprot:COSAG01_NODE_4279_length_5181_cov_556.950433_1_plen_83_part_10